MSQQSKTDDCSVKSSLVTESIALVRSPPGGGKNYSWKANQMATTLIGGKLLEQVSHRHPIPIVFHVIFQVDYPFK